MFSPVQTELPMIASRVRLLSATLAGLALSGAAAQAQAPSAIPARSVSGTSPEIRLATAPAGSIYGAVVDDAGTPVEGAVVSALAVVLSLLQSYYHSRTMTEFQKKLQQSGPPAGMPAAPTAAPSTPAPAAPKPAATAVESTNLPVPLTTSPTTNAAPK